jgi:1-deoxy-D-xylulose-5-phosphate reductoisomerase
MKKIAIIGSTGSIGKQSLQVIDNLKDVKIIALSANENINLLTKQIIKYQPKYFHIHEKYAKKMVLKQNSKLKTNEEIAKIKEIDLFIIASTGISGLLPMILALKSGKQVAIANKESLVIGGPFIQEILNKHEKNGAKLLPIDSEHSAIWQCMVGEEWKSVKNIILTASGGSLLNKSNEQMKKITPKDALNHPNWNMGNKITIDSATLFNKGLEVIEASILFNLPLDKINAIIHRESIVHSIVNFNDGSSKAHLGIPDMRIPIQYALTYSK